jgi:hypothetical protein
MLSPLLLKNRKDRQSDIGGSSATSPSSEPSEFATFVTDLCKAFVSWDIPPFKINNPEVKYFLIKYTQTDPPDESYYKCCLEAYEYYSFETV